MTKSAMQDCHGQQCKRDNCQQCKSDTTVTIISYNKAMYEWQLSAMPGWLYKIIIEYQGDMVN